MLSLGLFMLSSCKLDNVCVSYQSYFLLDENTQKNTFAYLDEEGQPRRDMPNTRKNKHGLVDPQWYVIKNYNKRVLPMEVVYPKLSDSAQVAGDIMMFAETDVVDSVALDSLQAAEGSFQYNNDQKFYNWYFKDKLVWKDEMIPPKAEEIKEETPAMQEAPSDTTTAKKPSIFKRVFKWKKKKKKKNSNNDQPDANDDTGDVGSG